MTQIVRNLPNNVFVAATNGNNPSALNPFVTESALSAAGLNTLIQNEIAVGNINNKVSSSNRLKYIIDENFDSIVINYGYLYNQFAIQTGKLAPSEWRVTTLADWTALETAIGGATTQAGKLKSVRTVKNSGVPRWLSLATDTTNSLNFNAIPSGLRSDIGGFSSEGTIAYFWTSSLVSGSSYSVKSMTGTQASISGSSLDNNYGLPVRIVRELTVAEALLADGTYLTDLVYQGETYKVVKIDGLAWTTSNLRATKYNDDTNIPLVTNDAAWTALTTDAYCSYSNLPLSTYQYIQTNNYVSAIGDLLGITNLGSSTSPVNLLNTNGVDLYGGLVVKGTTAGAGIFTEGNNSHDIGESTKPFRTEYVNTINIPTTSTTNGVNWSGMGVSIKSPAAGILTTYIGSTPTFAVNAGAVTVAGNLYCDNSTRSLGASATPFGTFYVNHPYIKTLPTLDNTNDVVLVRNAATGKIDYRSASTLTPSLTTNYIGYGSGGNTVTGSPDFTWNNAAKELYVNGKGYFGGVNGVAKLNITASGTGGASKILSGYDSVSSTDKVSIFDNGDIVTIGSLAIAVDKPIVIGNGTDGSWQMLVSGTDFIVQRKESGVWVTKSTITA